MKIDCKLPIAEIAIKIPGAAAVFESLGIDYACAGELSLDDAAHAAGVAPAVVIASLRRLRAIDRVESWSDRPLADLVHHLVAEHHRFVREELAAIALGLADLCTSSASEPDLLSLRGAFTGLSEMILPHLHREEENVFPAVEALEKRWESSEPLAVTEGGLAASFRQLADEHGAIAAQLQKLRELRVRLAESNEVPARCASILDKVATLEAHIHEYMFLENAVLFPRAMAMDAQTAA